MSLFKLDISNLRSVPVEERVKGNFYVVSNSLGYCKDISSIAVWHDEDPVVLPEGFTGATWMGWFEIPAGLPGFPICLPDNFEISPTEWEYEIEPGKWCKVSTVMRKFRRVIVPCREIVIPTAGRNEQIRILQEKLNELRGAKCSS